MKKLTTRKIALIAVFSALYYVLSFLPGIKIATGSANVSIQIEALMASIFGLLFGPVLGALAAFMGAFLAWVLPPGTPSPTSAVFLPAPIINAFTVGLIYTKRWKLAFITLAAVISAFWFLPPAQPWDQYFYVGLIVMWDKIAALALIIPAAILVNKMAKKELKISEDTAKGTIMGKIDLAFILSVIAAVLILVNAWMIALGENVKFKFSIFETTFQLKISIQEVISNDSLLWLRLVVIRSWNFDLYSIALL